MATVQITKIYSILCKFAKIHEFFIKTCFANLQSYCRDLIWVIFVLVLCSKIHNAINHQEPHQNPLLAFAYKLI
ncbi:hypothetical protein BpHYR1_018690 [Brachionus plicatilis]|uniref:Uncharacterized protein n=1 Tax=Brachionus plicatilis TaxID=10195 RepID=A0A3M7S5T8_BRAPC|nr:hypothetical protein BpHYR1_018690 [Brachionus plicatilis]